VFLILIPIVVTQFEININADKTEMPVFTNFQFLPYFPYYTTINCNDGDNTVKKDATMMDSNRVCSIKVKSSFEYFI
jgi:hypothetical protein